jgi:riboflavin synthase
MFTGIVEEVGAIEQAGSHMKVACRTVLTGSVIGSSIAVNGTCLTAVQIDADGFHVDLSPETLARTNLGDLNIGSPVNLERPVAVGDRLSGHIVQGHVDGTGEFLNLAELADGNWWLEVRVSPELDRYMILKGSIALDGISLTIAGLRGGVLSVAIIPHTYRNTTLHATKPGSRVNIEVDLIAKYVEKLVTIEP